MENTCRGWKKGKGKSHSKRHPNSLDGRKILRSTSSSKQLPFFCPVSYIPEGPFSWLKELAVSFSSYKGPKVGLLHFSLHNDSSLNIILTNNLDVTLKLHALVCVIKSIGFCLKFIIYINFIFYILSCLRNWTDVSRKLWERNSHSWMCQKSSCNFMKVIFTLFM